MIDIDDRYDGGHTCVGVIEISFIFEAKDNLTMNRHYLKKYLPNMA